MVFILLGSLTFPPEYFPLEMLGHETNSNIFSSYGREDLVVDVKGSLPHALFMDW